MNQTNQLPKLKPAIWEENRVSGILHWEAEPGKVSHCLMRWVSHPDSPLLLFSDLRSGEHLPSCLVNLASVTKAALAVLGERIKQPKTLQIWTHAGTFSTYDTLWMAPIDNWSHQRMHWNGHVFERQKNDLENEHGCPGFIPPQMTSFNLASIEAELEQLQWSNLRDANP